MTSFRLVWLVAAFCWISTVSAQYDNRRLTLTSSSRNTNAQYGLKNQSLRQNPLRRLESPPNIENIETKCSNTGITITVDFDGPFNGVIYSKGHFSNPRCRFVEANSDSRQVSFLVPSSDCGTVHQDVSKSISNVLVFQMDEDVQEAWDTVRRVSCSYSTDTSKHGKTVVFKPLSVGMLDIRHQPIKSDALDCWMDIQRGTFPNTEPISGQIGIGEELSVLIYLKDEDRQYDVSVKDCWAFESDNFEDPQVAKVQLTDYEGCSRKTKLIGNFSKTYDTLDSGATTIAYTNLTAFKFPDGDNVHLTCNIELCKAICEETCGSNSGGLYPQTTKRPTQVVTRRPVSTAPISFQPTAPSYIPTTTKKICYSEYDPGCGKQSVHESEDEILPGGYVSTTTTTTRRPVCFPGNRDIRCPTSTTQSPFRTSTIGYGRPQQPIDEDEYVPPGDYFEQTTKRPLYNPTTTREPYRTTTREPYRPIAQQPERTTTREPYRPAVQEPYRPTTREPYRPTEAPYSPTTREPYRPTQAPYRPTTREPYRPTEAPYKPTTREPYRPTEAPYRTTTREPYRPTESPYRPTTREPYRPTEAPYRPTTREPYRPTEAPYRPTTREPYRTTTREPYRQTSTERLTYPPRTTQATYQQSSYTPRATFPTSSTTQRSYQPYPTDENEQPGGYEQSSTTKRPVFTTPAPYRTTSKTPLCYPGTVSPNCPPDCEPQPGKIITDFRCRQVQPTQGSTTRAPATYPPRITERPTYSTIAPYSTTTRRPYQPYPTDENEGDISPGGYEQSSTTRRPYYTTPTPLKTTSKAPVCYPGSVSPNCPPDCDPQPGKIITDFRCRQVQPTQTPTARAPAPVTYPQRITERPTYPTRAPPSSTTTRQPYQPYPTDQDEGDISPGGYEPSTTTRRPYFTTQAPVRATSKAPLCYPGTVSPNCPPDCDPQPGKVITDFRCRQVQPTQPSSTRAPLPVTYPPRITERPTYPTRAPPPVTYPPRITDSAIYSTRAPPLTTTTRRPYQPYPTDENEEDISPGGYEQSTTTRRPYYTTSAPLRTTSKAPLCYPGTVSPNCPPDCDPQPGKIITDFRCRQVQPTQASSTRAPAPVTYPSRVTERTTYPTRASPVSYPPRITDGPPYPTRAPPVGYPPRTTDSPTYPTRAPPVSYPPRITDSPTYPTRAPPVSYPPRITDSPTYATRAPLSTTTTRRPYQPYPTDDNEGDVSPGGYEPSTTTRRPYYTTPAPLRTTSKAPLCYPGTVSPNCPPDCDPQPGKIITDFRCRQIQPTQPTSTRAPPPVTYPPRITDRPTYATRAPPLSTTTRRPYQPYPTDENEGDISPGGYEQSTTTRRPYYTTPAPLRTTSKAPLCYPGAVSPNCPPDCEPQPGKIITDFRCRQTTRAPPPVTYPPRITERPTYPTRAPPSSTTTRPYQPYPTDEKEDDISPGGYEQPTTTRRPYYTTPAPLRTTSKSPVCYPGSVSPNCPPDCDPQPGKIITDFRCRQIQPTQGSSTRSPFPVTYPPRINERPTYPTRAPPSSTTTRRPYQPYPTDDNEGDISPGGYEPSSTTRRPYYTTPAPIRTTSKTPLCYPGTVSPNCPPDCDPQPGKIITDFRCRQVQPTQAPSTRAPAPVTYPPRITERPTYPTRAPPSAATSSRPYQPYPTDENKEDVSPGGYYPTSSTSRPIFTTPTTTPKKIICYPGAIDPRCPAICPSSDFRCRTTKNTINYS